MDTWKKIEHVFDEEFALKIKMWFLNKETSVYTFEEIEKECASEGMDLQMAVNIMVDDSLLHKITAYRCPYCQGDVRPDDLDNDLKCSHCNEGLETLEEYFKSLLSR